MRKWRWPLLVGLVVGAGLALYFEPTRRVRGWLWGEAFFDGRPSSYWREVIVRDLRSDPRVLDGTLPPPPGPWWVGYTESIGIRHRDDTSFPLVGSPDADAVLHELGRQDDRPVAAFARDILQRLRPRQPFARKGDDFRAWFELVREHQRQALETTRLMRHD